ncbi:MAG TPA: hypothetical protein VGA50_13450 [Kiloniellales bacterium]
MRSRLDSASLRLGLALALVVAATPSVAAVGGVPTSGAAGLVTVPVAHTPAAPGSIVVPSLTTVAVSVACGGGWLPPAPGEGWATAPGAEVTAPSDYYAIELVPTGRVPGTRLSKGVAYTTAATSPFFGVALAPSGEYVHDLDVRVEGLKPLEQGAYIVWVTDTDITQVVRLGALDDNLRLRGQARWNKFLVVLTREPTDGPAGAWQGPVIMRGMSRSGRMHTLAGHGPFEAEPCAKYGFR